MSLIGVFRCGDSAVLLADSQETYGDPERGALKTEVNKIDLYYGPDKQLAYAAATASGDLSARLSSLVGGLVKSQASGTDGLRKALAGVVSRFHASDEYRNYPGEQYQKRTEAIVCIASPRAWPQKPVDVFRIAETTVHVVPDWHLCGIDFQLASHLAKRRHRMGMSIPEATLLGLYLFKTVERVSTWVGPPIRVAVVRPSEIHPQDQELTDLHLKHVTTIVEQLEDAVFAAPNLGEPDETMNRRWSMTCNSMVALRSLFRNDVADYVRRQQDNPIADPSVNDLDED
jgi:hypothetical protein